jgi:hypothetical protein
MLRGYGKRSGKEFPCAPKDICHEWDCDVNPYFKENPRLLGDYRMIFEPQWNPALAAVRAERMSSEDKFVLSGYWALLLICTPTWHRNAVDVADRQLADFIPLVARHLANEKPEYRDFVEEALAKGWDQAKPGRTTHQGHPYAASYADNSSPLPARLGCAPKRPCFGVAIVERSTCQRWRSLGSRACLWATPAHIQREIKRAGRPGQSDHGPVISNGKPRQRGSRGLLCQPVANRRAGRACWARHDANFLPTFRTRASSLPEVETLSGWPSLTGGSRGVLEPDGWRWKDGRPYRRLGGASVRTVERPCCSSSTAPTCDASPSRSQGHPRQHLRKSRLGVRNLI